VVGAGCQVSAHMSQKVPCKGWPGDLTGDHIVMLKCDAPMLAATEPWIQFSPTEWDQMIEQVFDEMVEAWNEKFGGGPGE